MKIADINSSKRAGNSIFKTLNAFLALMQSTILKITSHQQIAINFGK